MKVQILLFSILAGLWCASCTSQEPTSASALGLRKKGQLRVIIDTDANNELDDQHALAYAFANQDIFDIEGITINNTKWGNGIEGHYQEAVRVANLFNAFPGIKILKGASGNYTEIEPQLQERSFDGEEAVEFIIRQAKAADNRPLILVPIGKLTNIALALKKAPEIADKIRIVWLGSNYPNPGEYNLENDTTAVNPVIQSGAPFEMVLVRHDEPSGTAAVTVSAQQIREKLAGKGVKANLPVTGRHGGTFTTFGDYAVNLFENAELYGTPPSRPLYDMAALAIIKNPKWATKVEIPAPHLAGTHWVLGTGTTRKIWIWENFKREPILEDFFKSIEKPSL